MGLTFEGVHWPQEEPGEPSSMSQEEDPGGTWKNQQEPGGARLAWNGRWSQRRSKEPGAKRSQEKRQMRSSETLPQVSSCSSQGSATHQHHRSSSPSPSSHQGHPSQRHTLSHVGPMLSNIDPMLSQLGPMLSHLCPVLSHLGPMLSYLGLVLSHIGPMLSNLGPMLSHLGPR